METSFNCSVLSNETLKSLNEFSINIFKKNNETFTDLGGNRYNIEKFKVDHLKEYICKVTNSDKHATRLWKVNVVDEVGIKEMLKDENEMKPRLLFSNYFQDELSGEAEFTVTNIHVICIPAAQNLPETLEYRDPHPLLMTSGASWDFQVSNELKQKLSVINEHYSFWKDKQRDKTKIPQYFILAGAGEGKSRTAQELPKLLIECAEDIDLKNRLESALVFNLSFENGTRIFREEENIADHAISNRMIFQLLSKPNEYWNDWKNRYSVTPLEVLRRIAKHRGQDLSDLNVIIILDSIQTAMNNPEDGMNKDSFFYNCISSLATLTVFHSKKKDPVPFIITCVTATIAIPIYNFIATSNQRRIFLPVTSLEPPKINNISIFVKDNPVLNMLIDDMGGHGRALEALGDVIKNKDLDKENYVDIVNDVRRALSHSYQGWLSKTAYLKPILRYVLSNTPVEKDKIIIGTNKEGIKVDDILQYGLIRFECSDADHFVGTLKCPYIWLWIMAHANHEHADDPVLRNWDFNYYSGILNDSGESSVPPGCQYWQHFEYFVAQFRSLKSSIYDYDEQVELKVIHDGAKHNFGKNFIYNRKLTLSNSVKKVSTKSDDYWNNTKILCQKELVDFTEAEHVIINAPSAEYGDSFCPIILGTSRLLKTETHQCKLRKKSISQADFNGEHEKATSPGDIFIIYTSASAKEVELKPMSAIIDKDNWRKYFGPFSGRSYYYYTMGPLDINNATYTQLTGMDGIADKRAEIIINERDKRKFFNIEDCQIRTKVPRIS